MMPHDKSGLFGKGQTQQQVLALNVIGFGCLLAVPNRFCLFQMSKSTRGTFWFLLFCISTAAGEDLGDSVTNTEHLAGIF